MLSGIEPADLIRAVRGSDIARLTRIPGVGKKTSERIVVELRDRLPKMEEPPASDEAPEAGDVRDNLLSALVNLGYAQAQASAAIAAALRQAGETAEAKTLIRLGLRELAR